MLGRNFHAAHADRRSPRRGGRRVDRRGAFRFLRGSQHEVSRKRERTATLIGALAICAGFLVLLFALSR